MGEFIRWYLQDRPSCCSTAPNEDENELPPHLNPLPPGERKKGESVFPPRKKTEGASVRGDDEDEQVASHNSRLTPYFIFKKLLLVTK